MANTNTTTHVIRGKLHWAKILGEPRLNTYTNEREWSVDVTPDKKGLAEIKRLGISKKLRDPKENDGRKERFITFRQKEFRTNPKTGEKTANRPIKIMDAQGNDWPHDKLIGNETIADIKFNVRDSGMPNKGVYIQAIRILSHVPFEVQEFAPLSEDDEFFAGESNESAFDPNESGEQSDDDFDDDEIPF